MQGFLRKHSILAGVVVAVVVATGASAAPASADVGWKIDAVSEPSVVSAAGAVPCAVEKKCNKYQLLVLNAGSEPSHGTITLTDTLPAGLRVTGHFSAHNRPEFEGERWECGSSENGEHRVVFSCTFGAAGEEETIAAGHYAPILEIKVSNPSEAVQQESEAHEREGQGPVLLPDEAEVSGGGAALPASIALRTPVSNVPPAFSVNEFSFEPDGVGGSSSLAAGGHPWSLTTTLGVPSVLAPEGSKKSGSGTESNYRPVQNIKNVVVELPLGFLGNPQALGSPGEGECTQTELETDTEEELAGEPVDVEKCPSGSRVGVFAVTGDTITAGFFEPTENKQTVGGASPVFNIVPEAGFPAEFGFTYAQQPIYMYASVVHTPDGYRLRIDIPGVPTALETMSSSLTLFGEPGSFNGSGSTMAFLSNPANCSGEPLTARVELESWSEPGRPVSRETTAYPSLAGCNLLALGSEVAAASLAFAPSAASEGGTSQADSPSAFTAVLTVPQTAGFSEAATPPLRSVTATLPPGVSLNPAAAQGLVGCQASGPEGINIGSDEVGPGGRDLGDPEATELGAGHAGGNGSAYDDGLYHAAHGHCPAASEIGTLEVVTPVLPEPLHGRVYVAAPKCGGTGQPVCSEASASNGELFGAYLEVEGSGVVVKIPGTIAADPHTGQLTVSTTGLPQLPFSALKLHVHGGPRAPLANPQTCGQASTSSVLEPWGAPETPGVTSASAYAVAGCGAGMPFTPAFAAGTASPVAGAYSPFTLTLSRHDGEQDLSGLSETMPPGLLARLAGVAQCGQAQADAGTCGPESQIGTVTVLAGSGTDPLSETGGIYLTGPYDGGPFGISVVVPAVAGPFNLGNVVVRGSITIDPDTAQASVVSDPFPTIVDGVPLRVKTVNVDLTRPGFTLDPTNCAQQQVTGVVSAQQGSSATVSSPFAVTGCQNLGFDPVFSASTQGNGATKGHGASLDVKIAYPQPFTAYTNIAKVDTQLPLALSSRLSTLQKACTEAQFAANPAGCPAASAVGVATAITPLLNAPLSGPAYLVSHGGRAFPNLDIVLQGEGVTLDLVGDTDIKGGITYSKFETVPDAPVSSFELNLPEKQDALLGAVKNLCAPTRTVTVKRRVKVKRHGQLVRRHGRVLYKTEKVHKAVPEALTMPTTITSQSGAVIKQNIKIAVSECAAKTTTVKQHKTSKRKTRKHQAVVRRTGRS